MTTYFVVYIGAVILALIFTPLIIFVARSLNFYDDPDVRKVHARAVPRLGGIAIFLAALLMIIMVLLVNNKIGASFRDMLVQVFGLLAAGTFIFLVGLVDDLCKLRARTKFLAQLIACIGVCSCGILISKISIGNWITLNFGWWAWPLTIIWIAGITNAVNFIDGLDGLAAGISAIVCGVIAVFAIYTQQAVMAVLMLALLGSLSGFLFFNFNPAKIFMGDSGSMFLGFTLGAASVMCSNKSLTLVGLALPFLALGIPIFDMIFSMLRRVMERRSIFAPDRSHIHHRLLDMGLQQRQVVIFIYLATLIAAGMGMFMMFTRNAGTLVVFLLMALNLVLLFRVVGAVRLRETISRMKINVKIAHRQKEYRREFDEAILKMRVSQTFEDWWQALCSSAESLDLAFLTLDLKNRNDTCQTRVWRNQNYQPADEDDINLVQMILPLHQRRNNQPLKIEAAAAENGSLESAGQRLNLFTRLVDEYPLSSLPAYPDKKHQVLLSGDRAGPKVAKAASDAR